MAADLGDLLAKVLPAGVEITVRHISSTPTPCEALFAAAPGQVSEPTFCENHFLSVSIDSNDDGETIIFGMEVMVYNTAHLTTIFVSKADSTGFLHLLKLPRKVSVLRLVSNTFLSFLARTRQRPGVRLVVSLFARAQNQYLFPGSIENTEKHVLDDRGLIKWWCRVLDPILREHEPESALQETKALDQTVEAAKASATAYLIVPSCDRFETRNFFPPTAKTDAQDRPRWLNSYPLKQLCHDPSAPPRCLVPRFPDDPKTRFLIDLDGELPEEKEDQPAATKSGRWRSVRSLDQFWEMMSFRQECSAGRLVGFLWLVINPPGLMNSTSMESQTRGSSDSSLVYNGAEIPGAIPGEEIVQDGSSQSEEDPTLTKTTVNSTIAAAASKLPRDDGSSTMNPFDWPEAGRGQVVLSEADYKTMIDSVLDHFYDKREVVASTKIYVDQVSTLADELTWGKKVVGSNTTSSTASQPANTNTNNVLDLGLIRKRKKSLGEGNTPAVNGSHAPSESGDKQPAPSEPAGVNVLNASLVRKKKKT
ncbi:histone H3-K56 acetyltransferase [Penicillium cf. griseofulvum]|uniref:histone acetyltransferase n=1 Tax=Penicillium cf. griseofulvum TaxID=2972120 RepID=A0A9W9ME98_9EURO|nr:histone H3-K56 acetyltransferase [Penicillium cf. griseofulvum]KAJ5451007.1 histone H3-K56 acetyltransferase [Penicillium cf. griseofulvum]